VAYLRDRAQDYMKKSMGLEDTKHAARFYIPCTALEEAADAIERGEHWSTQGEILEGSWGALRGN